ncbi:MAG: hypothetical protein WCI88_11945 [Chloroflexota bacterium]
MDEQQIKSGRTRYFLIIIILATIPCYCAGLVYVWAVPIRPLPTPEEPTMIPSLTRLPSPTVLLPTHIVYPSPFIPLTRQASLTPSETPFMFPSLTPTLFLTPTPTFTNTPTITNTPTTTNTPTLTPTLTFTPTSSLTPTPTLTITPLPPIATMTAIPPYQQTP